MFKKMLIIALVGLALGSSIEAKRKTKYLRIYNGSGFGIDVSVYRPSGEWSEVISLKASKSHKFSTDDSGIEKVKIRDAYSHTNLIDVNIKKGARRTYTWGDNGLHL